MKIIDWLLGRNKKVVQVPISDAETASKAQNQNETVILTKIRRVKNPTLSFKSRPGTVDFEQPEYDMAEIGRIEDVESYVQRAFTQKDGLMFKEGYQLVGKNPQTIKYIQQRFNQISAATGIPVVLTAQGIGSDLVRTSNSFLVKVRNVQSSGGKVRQKQGNSEATINPVAGYFHIPVSAVKFKRDDNGKILKYRQHMPNGAYKDFSPEDVIHFYFRRKKGFLVGTPSLVPVKDDIRALRRIEENIEMLVYQHLFPLFHYKVGTETAPAKDYPDGTNEVDVVKQEIEIMPAEGMIVTPERHEITAVGSEGRALRAEGYLTHFKQRVFAGLGVSAIDMGEGDTANRGTADSMSRNLVDDVKHYQRTIEIFFNEYIIKELLLESTFDDPLNEDSLVFLKFNEIDIDSKVKVENHAVQAFSGYALTHSELRRMFGKEPFTEEEWEDSFWKRIEEPKALIQSIDEPYSLEAKAAARSPNTSIESEDLDEEETKRNKEIEKTKKVPTGGAKPGPSTTKRSSGQRSASAKTTPSNQHGQKTSPEKRKSFFEGEFSFKDAVALNNVVTKMFDDLEESTLKNVSNQRFDEDWFKQISLAVSSKMKDELKRIIRMDFRRSFRDTGAEIDGTESHAGITTLDKRVDRIVDRFIRVTIQQVINGFKSGGSTVDQVRLVRSSFDVLRFRSRFIYNSERIKAMNYGTLRGFKKLGIDQVEIISENKDCEDCTKRAGIKDINTLTLDDIPGFHPNCNCSISKVNKT